MNYNLLNTAIFAISFLSLFAIAEWLHHKQHIKVEVTRKLVHIGAGLLTLLFPLFLHNHWLVLFLCLSFATILILSLKFHFLTSINGIDRQSYGSIAYPFAVYGCYLFFDYNGLGVIYFYLPVLILAISDPIAALIGKRMPICTYKVGQDNKSVMGSGMFFISAFILSVVLIVTLQPSMGWHQVLLRSVIISLFSATTEGCSRKGLDNLGIPASVLCALWLLDNN